MRQSNRKRSLNTRRPSTSKVSRLRIRRSLSQKLCQRRESLLRRSTTTPPTTRQQPITEQPQSIPRSNATNTTSKRQRVLLRPGEEKALSKIRQRERPRRQQMRHFVKTKHQNAFVCTNVVREVLEAAQRLDMPDMSRLACGRGCSIPAHACGRSAAVRIWHVVDGRWLPCALANSSSTERRRRSPAVPDDDHRAPRTTTNTGLQTPNLFQ